MTSSLPRKCSTTELQQQNLFCDGVSSLFAVTKVVLFFNLPKLSAIFLVFSVFGTLAGSLIDLIWSVIRSCSRGCNKIYGLIEPEVGVSVCLGLQLFVYLYASVARLFIN